MRDEGSHRLFDRLLAFLGVVAVLVFQSGAYHFAVGGLSSPPVGLRLAYYGFWVLCGVAAMVCVARTRGTFKRLFPLYISLGIVGVLPLLYPPLGVASRSLVLFSVAVAVITTIVVSSRYAGAVLRLGAAVTAVTALVMLAEMFYPGTLSMVEGRSAGVMVNPNVAGAALVLSGTATAPFVPKGWRGPFAVLVCAGVLATVSRTSLLALIVATVAAEAALWLWGRRGKVTIDLGQAVRSAATALVCLVLFAMALQSNNVVATAATSSASTALASVQVAREARAAAQAVGSGSEIDGIASPEKTAAVVAQELGQADSGAARVILMLNAAEEVTPWGKGAEQAQALAPHNWYLFFAVAFGVAGIVSILGLTGAVMWVSRDNLPFAFAFPLILLFTHDLTMMALAVPIALGCASAVVIAGGESL